VVGIKSGEIRYGVPQRFVPPPTPAKPLDRANVITGMTPRCLGHGFFTTAVDTQPALAPTNMNSAPFLFMGTQRPSRQMLIEARKPVSAPLSKNSSAPIRE
jgi:hypothetical protein